MIIRCLWDQQADAIIDVKIGVADTEYYRYEPISTLLDWWETIKEDKHGKHCHNQQICFFIFVLSVDGMLGREDLVVLA